MRNTLFVIVLAYLAAVTAYAEDNSLFHFSATAGGAWGHFLEKGRSMDNSAYNFPGIPDSVGYVEIPGDRDKITGFGPAFEMKFGSDVGNFLLFVNTQFASINGEREIIMYDYKRWQDGKECNDVVREEMETDDNLFRFFLGMGFDYYPFRSSDNLMRGSFIGLSVGIMSISGGFDFQGVSASADLGYVWSVGEHLNVGLACVGTVDGPVIYGEDTPAYDFFTVWFGVRFEYK